MNMDNVFIKIEMVDGKPDALAVARTDRKGTPLVSYAGAVSTTETFSDLIAAMKKQILKGQSGEYVVVAHYPEVERVILGKEAKDDSEVFEGRLWVSTSQLMWPLVDCQMLPSSSFDSVCAYFGFKRADVASAEDDCTNLARVFFETMRRYRTSLLVEEGVRDFGGPTLDKFRKMIGL